VNVIGLGNCGCNIAEQFAKYPQYNVFRIDTEPREGDKFYLLPEKNHPEQYEAECPDLTDFLNCSGNVTFVVGGSGFVSACSLRILEQIKHCKISILYVKTDQELLGESQKLQQRATFHIFQEYARSGVFEQVILVDNTAAADMIGELSIAEYYQSLNLTIVPMVHFVNVFNNSKAVMGTFGPLADVSRIRTLGMVNVETGEEKTIFPLDTRNETRYYYAISSKSLKEDGKLHNKIRRQVKSKHEKSSFGIFETTYENNFCYSLVCSREIAKL